MAVALIVAVSLLVPAVPSYAGTIRPMVDVGYDHMIALKDDGTVWTWATNTYGQLGDGTTEFRISPVQVPGFSDAIQVDAGFFWSLALKSDGTVWAWGRNEHGQLGTGTTIDKVSPVQITGLSGIVAISAGAYHGLALSSDGTLYSWGFNNVGQIGDGTQIDRLNPVVVTGISGVRSILAQQNRSMVLKQDGTVWHWGDNSDTGGPNGLSPTMIAGVAGAIGICCENTGAHALVTDGTVLGWGQNGAGDVGDGTTVSRYTPVDIGLNGVVAVSGGLYNVFAIKSDGSVVAWGVNDSGVLGNGITTGNTPSPTPVAGVTNVASIATEHQATAIVRSDGSVMTSGNGNMLGRPTNDSTHFVAIPSFSLLAGPGIVIGLVAVPGDASATLSWTAVSGATSYNVKRATTIGGPYSTVAPSITGLQYQDSGLTNGATYYYVVSANNGTTEGPNSAEVSAKPAAATPLAPTGLSAAPSDQKVTLSWTAANGAESYSIKRATTGGGPYDTIATSVSGQTYADSLVTNGITYYYVVTAVNAGGESGPSNEASATPSTAVPAAPIGLIAVAGDRKVTLDWGAVDGAVSYNVKRATVAGGPYTTVATVTVGTSLVDSSVSNGTMYYYIVTATNSGGESSPSNEASAKPMRTGGNYALLTISLTTGAEKEYELSADQVTTFLAWYDERSSGTGPAYYVFDKAYNVGPFLSRKEYIAFDKIASFEVMDFNK